MEKVSLTVRGMSCGHCEKAVKEAVGELEGVSGVDVNLETKIVDIAFDASKVELSAIKEAIEDQGYDVE